MLTGVEDNASLPYASSLCGAFYDACPVKIDIPSLLVHLRARHVDEVAQTRRVPSPEAVTMAAASWVMASPARFEAAQRAGRAAAGGGGPRPARGGAGRGGGGAGGVRARGARFRRLPPPLSAWTAARD